MQVVGERPHNIGRTMLSRSRGRRSVTLAQRLKALMELCMVHVSQICEHCVHRTLESWPSPAPICEAVPQVFSVWFYFIVHLIGSAVVALVKHGIQPSSVDAAT